jgi:predicted nucleic acid-binding protein
MTPSGDFTATQDTGHERRASLAGCLSRLAGAGLGGGRTYDGLIAACAEASHAKALLTFNSRHFDPPPGGVTIVEPADPA